MVRALLTHHIKRDRPAALNVPALALVIAASACADGSSGSVGWMGSIDTTEGSVLVHTTIPQAGRWPPLMDAGAIEVMWNSERLSKPSLITASADGDTIVVADGTEVFVLTRSGRLLAVLGRRGKGPGEFTGIAGISPPYGDSLLIWDGGGSRLTWMRMDGTVLATQLVNPPGMFRRPRSAPLFVLPNGIVLAWSFGFVRTDGVADSVVIGLVPLNSDRATGIATIEDITWAHLGGVVGSEFPFGPRALYALSPAGRLALSDGVEYCIRVMQLVEERLPLRVCRDWNRQPVAEAGAPPPHFDDRTLGQTGPLLRRVVLDQKPGDLKNSVDELKFDTAERLWVRVVDATLQYHPSYMAQVPALRPPRYTWEVFAPDGRLIGRVRVPSAFRPTWIGEGSAVGLLDAEDGTVSIATVTLPSFEM